eukprot:jgi/Tetstr1/463016/TSEL_007955.t1
MHVVVMLLHLGTHVSQYGLLAVVLITGGAPTRRGRGSGRGANAPRPGQRGADAPRPGGQRGANAQHGRNAQHGTQ